MPSMITTNCYVIFSDAALAILIAIALASPPDLANLTISAHGLISISFSAKATSGQFNVDKLPSLIFLITKSSISLCP